MKKIVKFVIYSICALLAIGCESEEPIVFQGIRIGGKVTRIELSAATISDIGQTSATLSTEALTLDGNLPITQHGHVWSSVNQEPTTSDSKTEFGELTVAGIFITELENLVPNTTYFVRSYVITASGTGYSNQINAFTTSDAPFDVLVINEGNFFSGDGSLSTYQSFTREVNLSAFAAANGFPIGATLQNILPYNNQMYMVTNAPDKLEILDPETLESIDIINAGFENPIGFAAVGTKGYVSNWGDISTAFGPNPDSYITVIDLETNLITGTIDLNSRPQELLAFGDKVYIANEGGSSISVIDTNTDLITDIVTESGPSELILDANEHIWAICTGGFLVEIDPLSGLVVQTIPNVEVSGFDEKMTVSGDGNTIYFLSVASFPSTETKVFEFEITSTTAPSEALIEGENFYGIGIHPASNTLYIGNSNGFISNGEVLLYDTEGNELDDFNTGIGPNGFVFVD